MVKNTITRAAVGVLAGLAMAAGALAVTSDEKDETKKEDQKPVAGAKAQKEPQWKLGIQAWTYNRVTLFEAIDKAKAAGVKYIEAYPGQTVGPKNKDLKFDVGLSEEGRKLVKEKLKQEGVTLVNFGVVGLGDDEKSARKVFEFAKDMGIQTIVSEPGKKMMDVLDKLTEEFKINVAIHNHPKPSHYWNADTVLDAVKGHSKRIGACADTGHWVRSGLDPVECLKKLEGRIISLHFKDLNEKSKDAHDVPYGAGVCNVKAMMAELKRQGFSGVFSIEYEYHQDNPTPEVKECVEAFHKLAKEAGVKGEAAK